MTYNNCNPTQYCWQTPTCIPRCAPVACSPVTCAPVTCAPVNCAPVTCAPVSCAPIACSPSPCYYCKANNWMYQSCINAYQDELKKLRNQETSMEYMLRQICYLRNMIRNFVEDMQNPCELNKLLMACNFCPRKFFANSCCSENCNNCYPKSNCYSQKCPPSECCGPKLPECCCGECTRCCPKPCQNSCSKPCPRPCPPKYTCSINSKKPCNCGDTNKAGFKEMLNKMDCIINNINNIKSANLNKKQSCKKVDKQVCTCTDSSSSECCPQVSENLTDSISENCIKKHAFVRIGENYVSPSGKFECEIYEDPNGCLCANKNKSSFVFEVDYNAYNQSKNT